MNFSVFKVFTGGIRLKQNRVFNCKYNEQHQKIIHLHLNLTNQWQEN
jgi:hypothetical protein